MQQLLDGLTSRSRTGGMGRWVFYNQQSGAAHHFEGMLCNGEWISQSAS